jgi:hypothetical protein
MKMIKMALLGGAALAVSAAGAHADDLDALKAQIETLNARVAAMEAAPSVPAGYQLLTISEGSQPVIPGLEVLNKDARAYGSKATVISVMPTADAPAGTEIVWSGYARAALNYYNVSQDYTDKYDNPNRADVDGNVDRDDLDVFARGQLKVTGKTDTAVGEVGATIELRANLDGRREASAVVNTGSGSAELDLNGYVYVEQAWGYWAMTPELTLGGGFAGSLGNIGYGYDGACTCYYTDNADVALNPGDTTQMRLTYASGPFSAAIALEDATGRGAWFAGDRVNGDIGGDGGSNLGVAGEVKYSGDTFSGELAGVWRDGADNSGFEDAWQVGAGLGFGFEIINISAGAAVGSYNNGQEYWRASILASGNFTDEFHGEIAYGYTSEDYSGESVNAVLAGLYYDPVDQLTIGLEGEWSMGGTADADILNTAGTRVIGTREYDDYQTFQVDLVTVFRF